MINDTQKNLVFSFQKCYLALIGEHNFSTQYPVVLKSKVNDDDFC